MGNAACCGEEQKAPAELVEQDAVSPSQQPMEGGGPDPAAAADPLKVTVVSARGLVTKDNCEVYVTCQLQGKVASKCQTACQSLESDPTWSQEFELFDYERGDALEFAVFRSDNASTDEPLGKAVLYPEQFRSGYAGHLTLMDAKMGAHLSVKAAVGGDYPEMPPVSQEALNQDNNDEYKIKVKKTASDDKIGVDIVPQGGTCLRVKRIKEGLVMNWNLEHGADNHVKVGDFIVAVNGVRGNCDEILALISRDPELEVVLRRLAN